MSSIMLTVFQLLKNVLPSVASGKMTLDRAKFVKKFEPGPRVPFPAVNTQLSGYCGSFLHWRQSERIKTSLGFFQDLQYSGETNMFHSGKTLAVQLEV